MRAVRIALAPVAAIAACVVGSPVQAQDASPYLGKMYAEQQCASCHAVGAHDTSPPTSDAPSFRRIANTPGMTVMALRGWMYAMHPTMPNVALTPERGEHVFAWIMSLKSPAPQE